MSIMFPPHGMMSSPIPLPPVPPIDDNPFPLSVGDQGIDVSSWQSYPNWQQVRSTGRTFVFVKATESVDYFNPYYLGNWESIGDAGFLLRGAYHFAQPDKNTPDDEFKWFRSNIRLGPGDLPILDLETGSGDLLPWAFTFMDLCLQEYGKKGLFYSGGPFMEEHNLDNTDLSGICCGLWLAAYQRNKPSTPRGWQYINFWQYTETASVLGVAGGCDDSIFYTS